MSEIIDGFSKLSKEEKVKIICDKYFKNSNASIKTIKAVSYTHLTLPTKA